MELRGPNNDGAVELEEDLDLPPDWDDFAWAGPGGFDSGPMADFKPSLMLIHDGAKIYVSIQNESEDSQLERERLAQFVSAVQNETPGAFAGKVFSSAYLNEQLPKGLTGFEMYAAPQSLIKLIPQPEQSFGPSVTEILDGMGFTSISLLGMTSTIEGEIAKSGVALELSDGLKGIMGMAKQEPIEPTIPDWVPADVVDAQVISLDLLKFYESIKDMVSEMSGSQADGSFAQANMGATAYLGMDIPSILNALGDTHTFVKYPIDDEELTMDSNLGERVFMDPTAGQNMRMGWVQEVRDAEASQTFMNGLIQTMNLFSAPIQTVEEQGYDGWRFSMPELGQLEISMLLGQGRMVAGFTEFSTTNTLNYLANPPQEKSVSVIRQ